MAREARKQLADLRAMEEEYERVEMHGRGKHFTGAGATPSMGLSQFRGGLSVRAPQVGQSAPLNINTLMRKIATGGKLTKKDREFLMTMFAPQTALSSIGVRGRGKLEITHHDEEEEESGSEEEHEGGAVRLPTTAITRGLTTNLGRFTRLGQRALRTSNVGATQAALRLGERTPLLATRPPPLVRGATTAARRVQFGTVPRQTIGTKLGTVAATSANVAKYALSKVLRPSVIQKLVTLGIPIGMLASYLSDKAGASGDAGYYDDFAGGIPAGGEGTGTGTGGESDVAGTGGKTDDEIVQEIVDAINRGSIPDYLRTGIYELGYSQPLARGRGKKAKSKATGKRAERAAIVKKVMAERGVSLAQASKIVKEEGLY